MSGEGCNGHKEVDDDDDDDDDIKDLASDLFQTPFFGMLEHSNSHLVYSHIDARRYIVRIYARMDGRARPRDSCLSSTRQWSGTAPSWSQVSSLKWQSREMPRVVVMRRIPSAEPGSRGNEYASSLGIHDFLSLALLTDWSIYKPMYVSTHVCIYTFMYVNVYMWLYISIYICMYVCIVLYPSIYIYLYVYLYIIGKNSQPIFL